MIAKQKSNNYGKQTTDLLLVVEWPRCLLRWLAALLACSSLASCGALREGMVWSQYLLTMGAYSPPRYDRADKSESYDTDNDRRNWHPVDNPGVNAH